LNYFVFLLCNSFR
jgi:hypothetical protein